MPNPDLPIFVPMKSWRSWLGPLIVGEVLGLLIIGIVHVVPKPEGGWRFMLIDDAMISMCYARSLTEGCGWVWYCGAERVQGYTNFLWTLYMAFWHFLGFSGDIGALPILLTGLITIGMQIYWLYRLGEVVGGEAIGRMSAWVGAVFFPLIRWHVSGMETGVLAVLLTYYLYRLLRVESRWRLWDLVWVGVGVLVRMDFAMWAVGLAAWAAYTRKSWRLLWEVMSIVGIAGIALIAFQWAYYGEPVPHTYYVKVRSVPLLYRVLNGLISLAKYMYVNLALFATALYGLWRLGWRQEKSMLLGLSFGLGVLYNLHVGGDAWENPSTGSRFLLMGILGVISLAGYGLSQWGWGMKFIGLLVIFYGIPSPRLNVESMRAIYLYKIYQNPTSEKMRGFYYVEQTATNLSRIISPGKVVAVRAAGSYPYFYREYRWLDVLGLCSKHDSLDPVICSIRSAPLIYLPGHTHAGWKRALREADVFFDKYFQCKSLYDYSFPFSWQCKLSGLLGHDCCMRSHYSGPYPNAETWMQLCKTFTTDSLQPAIHWRTVPKGYKL